MCESRAQNRFEMSRLMTNLTKNITHLPKFLPFHAFKIIILLSCLVQFLFKKNVPNHPLELANTVFVMIFFLKVFVVQKNYNEKMFHTVTLNSCKRRTISIFHGKVQRQWKR